MSKAKFDGLMRIYTCKRCGRSTEEPYISWKKKAQKHKNVCPKCLKKAETAAIERTERAKHARYMAKYGPYCCL